MGCVNSPGSSWHPPDGALMQTPSRGCKPPVTQIWWFWTFLVSWLFGKIIKIIVATGCHILRLKCTKFYFGCGSLQRSPDPLPEFKGPTSKEREGTRREWKGRKKKGREGGTPWFLLTPPEVKSWIKPWAQFFRVDLHVISYCMLES